MIIFYSDDIREDSLTLTAEDSAHCARVLRHRAGDNICVIDGRGTMYDCIILDANPSRVQAGIKGRSFGWHSHPYQLCMAVCPTKNSDRMEWFVEKAVEIGVDEVVPLIAERSERRVFKTERLKKIALSATKQSLKATLPDITDPVTIKDFLEREDDALKLIACCYDGEDYPRRSIKEAVREYLSSCAQQPRIIVLIGPEGDFSESELRKALASGYIPVHIGESRLRTETAAMLATAIVYSEFL